MNGKMPELLNLMRSKFPTHKASEKINYEDSTAVILVSGYSGIGLYSLFELLKTFHNTYKNFIFISVGIVDADSFHNHEHLEQMKVNLEMDLGKYKYLIKQLGCHVEYQFSIGTDVAEEVEKMVPDIIKKYPNSTFIGGQLIFDGTYRISRILHNFTIFSIQRRLYKHGLTTVIIPISLEKALEVKQY
jgi:hypothetical protein